MECVGRERMACTQVFHLAPGRQREPQTNHRLGGRVHVAVGIANCASVRHYSAVAAGLAANSAIVARTGALRSAVAYCTWGTLSESTSAPRAKSKMGYVYSSRPPYRNSRWCTSL